MKRPFLQGAYAMSVLVATLSLPAPSAGLGTTHTFWVFAHPDDETLAAAGAMVEQGDAGRHTVLILTNGEATGVRRSMDLSEAEVSKARQQEAKSALEHVGITDVRFAGLPDGGLTTDMVVEYLRPLLTGTGAGVVAVRGHTPLDEYVGDCGHADHCAVGEALVQLYREELIDDLELYRLGHLFGGPLGGTCRPLTPEQSRVKQAMRSEYALQDPASGRLGIGGESVPTAWRRTEGAPECQDPLAAVLARVSSERILLPLLAINVALLAGLAALLALRRRSGPDAAGL